MTATRAGALFDPRRLILIKHSAPQVDPGTPPERWELSEEGRARCRPLADAVARFAPTRIVSSVETKASETARLIAGRLGLEAESAPGLQEHDRGQVPHMPSRQFISMMALMFARPSERVLGAESADEAGDRFAAAVEAVVEGQPAGPVAIVTHGTVLALYLSRHGAGRAFDLWRAMGLPSLAVLELPTHRVVERIDWIK